LKNNTTLKIILLSLALSSCGLIEKFKTPEQPTEGEASSENIVSANDGAQTDSTDDLFSKTLEETDNASTATDAPTNIAGNDDDMKSLEEEFSSVSANDTAIKESSIAVTPTQTDSTLKQEAPVLVEEALPEIKNEVETASYNEAGAIKTYRVQRGETLMQIAFKLYGDISKWKDIKNLNSDKMGSNTSLKANTELKYRAPASQFVWNPNGTPYLIKNGETLGTISNAVYSTPKKWKAIWENNKPLIKNPNVIYAGFTLYYTNGGMANYVQPKAEQPKKEILARELANSEASKENLRDEAIEEVIVANKINQPAVSSVEENQIDEAMQTLSSTKRAAVQHALERASNSDIKPGEIDLINNISVPHEQEMAPDIDEEIQTL
jgi:LysM repeat protein